MRVEQARSWLIAMLLVTWPLGSLASVGGGISGYWYNQDQSGHGLSVTVPDLQRGVAIWHVYDASGNPLTLYLDGTISGRTLSATVYAPKGMVFGEFDPADLDLPVWGSAELRFNDCQTATLSWHSEQAEFGSGDMDLQRLAIPMGVRCEVPVESPIPPGMYHGERVGGHTSPLGQEIVVAVVDGLGRLWLAETAHHGVPRLPADGRQKLAIAMPAEVVSADRVELGGRLAAYPLMAHIDSRSTESLNGQWQAMDGHAEVTLYNGTALENSSISLHLVSGEPIGQKWLRDADVSDFAGTFEFQINRLFTWDVAVTFNDQGEGCYASEEVTEDCLSQVRLTRSADVPGLFNVSMPRVAGQALPLTGQAWLMQEGDRTVLQVVASNGPDHFAIYATREVGQ